MNGIVTANKRPGTGHCKLDGPDTAREIGVVYWRVGRRGAADLWGQQ